LWVCRRLLTSECFSKRRGKRGSLGLDQHSSIAGDLLAVVGGDHGTVGIGDPKSLAGRFSPTVRLRVATKPRTDREMREIRGDNPLDLAGFDGFDQFSVAVVVGVGAGLLVGIQLIRGDFSVEPVGGVLAGALASERLVDG
jgi:hypothetical protein